MFGAGGVRIGCGGTSFEGLGEACSTCLGSFVCFGIELFVAVGS